MTRSSTLAAHSDIQPGTASDAYVPASASKLLSSYGLLAASSIAGQLLGFIGLAVVARRLGPHNLGAYGFAAALATYFALPLMPGTAMVGIRDLATPGRSRGQTVAEVQTFLILNGAIAYLALFLLAPVLSGDSLTRALIPLAGLPLIINAVGLDWAMQGTQRLKPLALYRFLGQVAYLAVLLAVLTGGATGAKRYALCNALGFAVTATLTVIYVRRRIGPKLGTLLRAPRNLARRLHHRARRSFVPSVSLMMIQVYYSVDIVLLGYLRGNHLVGEYTVAARLPLAVTALASLWVTAFYPHATSLFYTDKERLRSQVGQFSSLSIVAALPLVAFGFVIGREVMEALFGSAYGSSGTAFAILLSSSAAALLNANIAQVLLACGDNPGFLLSVTLGAVLNVVLNLALIPSMGIAGSALATLLAESVVIGAAAIRLSRTVGHIDLEWRRLTRGAIALAGATLLLLVLNNTVPWWAALLAATAAYAAFALVTRAVTVQEAARILRPGA
jgi:O-antigen/teichoic acid export membrane protein